MPSRPPGWCLVEDVKYLRHAARNTPGNILEIGCNNGQTTREMALAGGDRTVYAVDWTGPSTMCTSQRHEQIAPPRLAEQARDLPNVVVLDQNSRTMDWSQFELVTMVFIDGDHSYQGVRIDTENAVAYLQSRRGGLIVWHDVCETHPTWVGVLKYLQEFSAKVGQVARLRGTWLAIAYIQPE